MATSAATALNRNNIRSTMAVAPTSGKEELQRYSPHKWLNLVVSGLRAKHRSGIKVKTIAEKTGLCQATISRFIHNESKQPHMNTIIVLMKYLGYKLYAEL